MLDYPRLIAARIAAAVGDGLEFNGENLAATNVFSEANPSRDWLGEPTVEVDETEVVAKAYISGASRDVVTVVVLVRAVHRKSASMFALWLTQNVVEPFFVEFSDAGNIDGYAFDGLAVASDARNLSVGETFAARLTYTVHEQKYFI